MLLYAALLAAAGDYATRRACSLLAGVAGALVALIFGLLAELGNTFSGLSDGASVRHVTSLWVVGVSAAYVFALIPGALMKGRDAVGVLAIWAHGVALVALGVFGGFPLGLAVLVPGAAVWIRLYRSKPAAEERGDR